MPIIDTYKKLVREAFKDMTPSEQQDFLTWALDSFLRRNINQLKATLKESSETNNIPHMGISHVRDAAP